jgi:3-oxoadipate enol-lactonase
MLKIKVNGIELAYERRGKGTPLMLVHGYPLDHTIWEPTAAILENTFDVILPDLRGFGESSTRQAPYLFSDMAADLAGLLDSLKIETINIAGHSMGGYITLAFARAYPKRMAGLGLVGSHARADSPEKKIERAQEAEHTLLHGVREVAEDMSTKLTADTTLQTRLKELMLRQRPEGLAGALNGMAERLDAREILPSFDFPVVIIHGIADKIVPIERAREVRALVRYGSLVEIEGAGHMPMMEAPQAAAEALKGLLK